MWPWKKFRNKASSRQQIQVKEVKDSILVLPKNQYRIILETSSFNFELKSEEEQDVLVDSFQNFLNSLPCQLQILIRIRDVDIDRYLEQISRTKHDEKEQVYKEQISNYCLFVKGIVSGNKILSRRFYVIIPYRHPAGANDFNLAREQINLNRDIVIRGLEKLGLKARQLASLEILDLFYSFYNPHQTKTQKLKGQTLQMLLQNNDV